MTQKLNTILLIDDDEATNYLNKLILSEIGFAAQIKVVQSGTEAIEYLIGVNILNSHGEFSIPPPELIFLDINMPAMDGWEFIDNYKDVKKGKVVMIMVTTSLNPEDEERAKNIAEVTEYKSKPLSKEVMLEILEDYFS